MNTIQKNQTQKLSPAQLKQREEDFQSFATARVTSADDISARPISDTLGKLIAGTALVGAAIYIGSFIPLGSGSSFSNASFIGCFVGLWIVKTAIFGSADPLDKRRWAHQWHGDLFGYWLAYLPLLVAVMGRAKSGGFSSLGEIAAAEFGIFVAASLAGFFVGLLNVWRCDAGDKREVLASFQEWQKQ
jgi:hypothetical protein